MGINSISIIMFVLVASFKLSSQHRMTNLSLLPDSVYQESGVFLRIQTEDILLINSSSNSVDVYANTGLLWYEVFAIDGNGEWRTIDNRGVYCGVGFGYYRVPPYYYSWAKGGYKQLVSRYGSSQNALTTKIRICMDLQNGEQICSEPKDAEIEKWRFLPQHLYAYEINKNRLTTSAFEEQYPNTQYFEDQIALFFKAYGLQKPSNHTE